MHAYAYMRSMEADNRKLCELLGLYFKGETAMETPAKRSRLWVARNMIGLESQSGIWKWSRHWRGRCLQAGLDPETFEVTDRELFNSWWTSYERDYAELKRKQRHRIAERQALNPGQDKKILNGPIPESKGLEQQGVAIFKLPKFK